MSPGDDLGGVPLFDLFRMEVEAHTQTLDEGLLALESRAPDAARLEALMRAAHSAKGAMRIVGLDGGVGVAHAMEDVLVAAQKGQVALGPAIVDALLAGNDLLKEVAKKDEAGAAAYLVEKADAIAVLVERIRSAANKSGPPTGTFAIPTAARPPGGQPTGTFVLPPAARPPSGPPSGTFVLPPGAHPFGVPPPASPAAPTPPPLGEKPTSPTPAMVPAASSAPARPGAAAKKGTREDAEGAAVRVSATGLGRMLAYAGESLVEARRLGAAATSLEDLRRLASHLLAATDGLVGGSTASPEAVASLRELATQARRRVTGHLESLDAAARRGEDLAERLYREVLSSRMRPFGDVVGGFPRLVRDLCRDLGKKARFEVRGKDVLVDRDVLDRLDAPLNHLLRNSVDHGLEAPEQRTAAGKGAEGQIVLEARHRAGMLEIEVRDDGRGVDYEALRRRIVEKGLIAGGIAKDLSRDELLEFLFLPGFSTKAQVTQVSGRGVGLDVVHTLAKELGGAVRAHSETGRGIRFVLTLPITRSVIRAALVEIAGEPCAFPLARIERLLRVPSATIQAVEGRESFPWEGAPVGLVPAARALGVESESRAQGDAVPVVLLSAGSHLYGLAVDRFLGEQDLVVRPLDPRLGKVANLAAVSVDEGGAAVLILDVDDLVRTVDQLLHDGQLRTVRVTAPRQEATRRRRKRVLVVDDSITVREVERGLLTSRGFLVDTAVDGVDGWNALRAGAYDLVVTDVDMPRMNGIELVRKIKQDDKLRRVPVMIVSYKDREEDRARGLEAGAEAYVTKSAFQEESWIGRVVDLVGEPEEEVT